MTSSRVSLEADRFRDGFHTLDGVRDQYFEWYLHQGGAFLDHLAVDPRGKRLVLPLLQDAHDGEVQDASRRSDECCRGDQPSQLVNREKSLLQVGDRRDIRE